MDIGAIFKFATLVISASSMISSALPNKNKKGERVFVLANKILNILAFNFGHAKNADN